MVTNLNPRNTLVMCVCVCEKPSSLCSLDYILVLKKKLRNLKNDKINLLGLILTNLYAREGTGHTTLPFGFNFGKIKEISASGKKTRHTIFLWKKK